ncbi:hypothetical protein Tco_0653943 [Tanacetum coccineum]|uniref:Uncharacterized protein n=1 Tax=Tanacetum coccineum TaxID=301880 RepID=A0ABQ4X1U3_9ASTR
MKWIRVSFLGIDLISMMHKKLGNGFEYLLLEGIVEGEQRKKEVFTRNLLQLRMPRSGIESEQWDHLLDSLEGVMLSPSEDRWWSLALGFKWVGGNFKLSARRWTSDGVAVRMKRVELE